MGDKQKKNPIQKPILGWIAFVTHIHEISNYLSSQKGKSRFFGIFLTTHRHCQKKNGYNVLIKKHNGVLILITFLLTQKHNISYESPSFFFPSCLSSIL